MSSSQLLDDRQPGGTDFRMYWETQPGSSQASLPDQLTTYWNDHKEQYQILGNVTGDGGDLQNTFPSTVPNTPPAKLRRLHRFRLSDDCKISYEPSTSVFRIGGTGVKEIEEAGAAESHTGDK